jgi:hypothetical protein
MELSRFRLRQRHVMTADSGAKKRSKPRNS